jgi:hypothetical protein
MQAESSTSTWYAFAGQVSQRSNFDWQEPEDADRRVHARAEISGTSAKSGKQSLEADGIDRLDQMKIEPRFVSGS